MKVTPLLTLRLIVGLALLAAVWTICASLIFLVGTGLILHFDYPLYQWWLYALFGADSTRTTFWLQVSAAASSCVCLLLFAGFLVVGPDGQLRRGAAGRTKPPVRGRSDNFGHAEWLSMKAAQALFSGPTQEYGGVVIGEAYRVDLDSVADKTFNPADKSTWGQGGKAPLLIDACKAGPTHSLVFAGAGSFKSTSAVSTLLTWTGSAVILDPSCELGPMLSPARQQMGHHVHELSLENGVGFNVLDWIDTGSPLAATNALSVVDWVCGDKQSGKDPNSDFFASRAKALVACLLCHMLWDPGLDIQQKTLRQLRAGISLPEDEMRELLSAIHQTSDSQVARDYAGTLKGLVAETFSGIYAHADETTAWLANPAFAKIVSGNSFTTNDLLTGRTTVFIQIPLAALQTAPAVGRTIIGALLNSAYEANGQTNGRILYLLDEVARLGPMSILETARDAGRKYGITLQLLYQSVGQLEKQWGKDGKREWYDGVSHRTYAAIQDLETARELEETFGNYAVDSVSRGTNKGSSGKLFESSNLSRGSNFSRQEMSRALIRREELMNDCRTDEAFVIVRGARPLRCGRAIYFRRPEMVSQVTANRFNKTRVAN
ncbi:conjugal transfer protein TraG [Rhizobium leguminosarum]|uniref:type IV secretory system conjugative DNA transfer family protein n=1 Tax=Rhizobium TaxID=379 RepID=UPI001030491E|nr:type IV secretory system conjugative DNA transfer family protein [Rhizobium leguminosarum]TBF87514.1 conjugal transfer protein TraG [Rhizobium leguminosarum]TBG06990.1 conjugal transfer protein TraG [Rhizobium leguminosarum]TBG07861.1 conjugal transfer protein TraG [Rhizobium leguminosarum]TBG30027.1 conjugal transfer protein TraG [Rhizobium leguminosarum]TBG50160.1 conjugal transfer protein TraG [Rhizobium leguminosarum]